MTPDEQRRIHDAALTCVDKMIAGIEGLRVVHQQMEIQCRLIEHTIANLQQAGEAVTPLVNEINKANQPNENGSLGLHDRN
jgi:hypothetical protein